MSRSTEAQDAERSVLSAVLLDNDAYERVELRPDHFGVPAHRDIWAAAASLHSEGAPIDVITLSTEMERQGSLNRAGGVDFLVELDKLLASATNIEHHADIVRNAADCRALDAAARRLHAALKEGTDFQTAHAEHVVAIERIARGRPAGSGFLGFDQLVPEAVRVAMGLTTAPRDAEPSTKPRRLALPTGFPDLDRMIGGGIEAGDLLTVAGRPSMGKTAAMLQLACGVARSAVEHDAGDVLVFSLETRTVKLVDRVIAQQARVEGTRVGRTPLTRLEIEKIEAVAPALQALPIHIDDTRHPAEDIARVVTRWPRPVAAFCVDYIQILRVRKRVRDARHRISHAIQTLKDVAQQTGARAIVLAQIGRPEKRGAAKPPTMADLKESGAIEEVSDGVILLHRPPYYAKGQYAGDPRDAEWIVDKCREAGTGTVPMRWDGPYIRFDPAPAQQDTGWGG